MIRTTCPGSSKPLSTSPPSPGGFGGPGDEIGDIWENVVASNRAGWADGAGWPRD